MPVTDLSGQRANPRDIGYANDDLRIPLWVRMRISHLGRHFTGKIVINVAGGAVPNFQVEPSGGDRLTFYVKH
jgi:hypothetical protein